MIVEKFVCHMRLNWEHLLVTFFPVFYEVDTANAPDGKAHKKAAGLQGEKKVSPLSDTNYYSEQNS